MKPEYFSQLGMEQALKGWIEQLAELEKDKLDGMLQPRFVSCNWAARQLTLSFSCQQWMCNPVGNTHGGIIASALDVTMGILSCYQNRFEAITPTTCMNISYLRAVPPEHDLVICATLDHPGNTLMQLSAKGWMAGSAEKAVVTSNATYYVIHPKAQ